MNTEGGQKTFFRRETNSSEEEFKNELMELKKEKGTKLTV